jgi:hypothetical protein
MTNPLAVNDALDRIGELDGMPVELEGILAEEPEGYHLLHYPKLERKPDYFDLSGRSYPPSVVVAFGNGSLQPNDKALSRWVGKRVRVHGVLYSTPLPRGDERTIFMGLVTPARIEPYSVQRLTSEERREHGA